MELENVYRGDVILCSGLDVSNKKPIVRKDLDNNKYVRYGTLDSRVKHDTALIKIRSDLYLALFNLYNVSDCFDDSKLLFLPTYPIENGSYYIDIESLHPYVCDDIGEKVISKIR